MFVWVEEVKLWDRELICDQPWQSQHVSQILRKCTHHSCAVLYILAYFDIKLRKNC